MTKLDTEYFPPASGPLAVLTKPIAVLRFDPSELSKRIGLTFQPAHDDLDALEWTRVTGLSGRPYALVSHKHSPQPGTQIVAPHTSVNVKADLVDVLNALELTVQDLVWTAEEATENAVADQRERSSAKQRRSQSRPKWVVTIPPRIASRLAHVHGKGRVQTLLRKFRSRVTGTELAITPAEVQQLLTYSIEPRTKASTAVSSKSSKKVARKK